MTTILIILGVLAVAAGVYFFLIKTGKIKDEDNDLVADVVDAVKGKSRKGRKPSSGSGKGRGRKASSGSGKGRGRKASSGSGKGRGRKSSGSGRGNGKSKN